MAKGLQLPFVDKGSSNKFRYRGGTAGGHDEHPPVGPSDHGALSGSQSVGQPEKSKSVIGQNKEWSTGG